MGRGLITYISTYGYKCINAGNGIPLEVGAAGRSAFLYTIRDDTGDNISEDNEYYGDLTALYWIWKNGHLDSHDYVAFRHYNKHLYIKEHDAVEYLKSTGNGWIVAKACANPPHNFVKEWETFREIIKNKYPIYYPELLALYDQADGSGNKCNAANMFITSAEQMNRYCEVLFKICRDLRERIGDTEHTRYDQRYCAFMAERFLTVYINTHSFPRLEVEVCRNRWVIQKMIMLAKALGFRNNNPVTRRIAAHLRKGIYKSSYIE